MSYATEYWRTGQGLGNITPPGCPHPEGEEFRTILRDWVGEGYVCDFGCGVGRLAPLFSPARYIGVDICESAITRAREQNPHDFEVIALDAKLPLCDVVIAHTVLLHVPDDEIVGVISRIAAATRRAIVSEIPGEHWRRTGNPPVFNRSVLAYDALFRRHGGMSLKRGATVPYSRYESTNLAMMEFAR